MSQSRKAVAVSSKTIVGQGVVAGSIPLFAGHPAPELLPVRQVRAIADSLLSRPDASRLFNYGDEQGDALLIDFLRGRLRESESLPISRENLMIIGGSTWGVDMITHTLTQPGDVIIVDAPTYRDALHIFRDAGLQVIGIPIDEGGVRVDLMAERLAELDARGKRAKFYYVVPNFQNPSGITLSLRRREAIIQLGRRHGFAIVEDDVYRDLAFVEDLPPSFYALAGGRGVVRLGSFSKTLAPGLRMGWLLSDRATIKRFVESGKLAMGGGANPFTAALVAECCQTGFWAEHVAWLRWQYKGRRDCALTALEASMPAGVSWTKPDGGYFVWLTLPDNVDVRALARRAEAEQVFFAPGPDFFVDSVMGARHLRLSFSYLPLEDMRRGIGVLGRLMK